MGSRRQSREAALQMLYLSDNCNYSFDEIMAYCNTLDLKNGSLEFAEKLFKGTWEKKEVLDRLINEYAENWELDRMAAIDRNILRLAAYEIMEMPETPISVIIDEAVEIAKRYSTSESGKFVNGILDKMKAIRNSKKD
jgi:transcription antitermination factor NusB